MKKTLKIFFILVFIALFFFSVYKIAEHYILQPLEINTAVNQYKEIVDNTKDNDDMFAKLQKKNPEIKSWLKYPGIGVDLPVLKNKSNQYYLTRGADGNYSGAGSLFLSKYSNEDSDVNVIFGHNMKNLTMFGKLDYLKDISFLRKNNTFTYYTPNHKTRYIVFAVCNVSNNYSLNNFNYTLTEYSCYEDFENFVDEIKSRSLFNCGLRPRYGEQVLILSTCDYDFKDERVIAVARPIHNDESISNITYTINHSVKMPVEY